MVSRITSRFLFATLFLIAGSSLAWAQVQPTGTWATESSGDTFQYGASCTDGTYLYILGGYQAVGSTTPEIYARFRRYDPAANAWINMGLMAAGTTAGSAVWGAQYGQAAYHSLNGTGRIFTFGGYNYNGTVGSTAYTQVAPSNAIRQFTFTSATTGTWIQLSATLAANVYFHAAVTMGDRIYIGGGATTNVFNIFNPTATPPTCTTGTTLPTTQYYHGMAAVPALNKIYSLGGYNNNNYNGINFEYTPQDNDSSTNDVGGTWQTRAPITNASNAVQTFYIGCRAISLNNRVYVTGYTTQGVANSCFEYNPITDTWVQRANSTYGRQYYHAWEAINGKGYSYGGTVSANTGEEYTPPNFGSSPHLPTNIQQVGSQLASSEQALPDSTQTSGWTNNQISFTANVTDPDAGQQVRWRVQVKPQAAAWTSAQVVTLQTPLGAQGFKSLSWTIPANSGYDWRWRVEDAFANSYPAPVNAWVEAFGTLAAPNTNSPDFRSDQLAPTDPVGQSPSSSDIQVPDPSFGPVTLRWIEATDNGPVSGISYELQVARDGGFNDIEAQLFSTAGQDEYPITLSVSRFDKFWRIRARDVGGNFSQWSQPLVFRVTYDDRVDHGAGDAKKQCGFSAMGAPALTNALLGLAILGLFFVRRTQNPEPGTKNS